MDATITSKNNERIRKVKRLLARKHRDHQGMFLLEGVRVVEEALETSLVDELYFAPRLLEAPRGIELLVRAKEKDIPSTRCSEEVLGDITDTVHSQAVVAVVRKPTWPIFCQGVMLVADAIADPGNMGTLMRTAVGAGVQGLLVVEGSVDLYNPKVLRASMGAMFHLPHWLLSREQVLALVRESGSPLVIADLFNASNLWEVDYPANLALVIGNEAWGIHEDFRREADLRVQIPLVGRVESLNASVAAGVLLYEILRQHRQTSEKL
ncbi:MAG TPA: hypothetical protein DDW87_00855 [Firmicutes bacterium]|mgnify:FL=1|nr:hypothetical protein [Bacillota bacterium]